MYNYLIVGNGIAGLKASEVIRKNDKDKSILIISNVSQPTYWRTRLSELICKDFNEDDIYVKNSDWYEKNKIEERFNTVVKKLDVERKVAILDDGEEIAYEKALIATGSHPFIPPIKNSSSKGVFAIRSIEDLNKFKKHIKENKKVIVIGGGLLGLEAAFSIKKAGCDVLVLESFDHILGKQLDNELSEKLEKELNKAGIKTQTGKNTTEILAEDGKVIGVKLDDGSNIFANTILIQAGVRNNLELAKESGLLVDRGIKVDEFLKTSADNIYAAGDCVQLGEVSVGLWTASMEMGQIAGSNMTGDNKTYQSPKPFSQLMLGNIKLFSAGLNKGDDIREEKREVGENIYKLFKRGESYVGAILWQDTKYQMDVKKIVFEKEDLSNTQLGKEIFGL